MKVMMCKKAVNRTSNRPINRPSLAASGAQKGFVLIMSLVLLSIMTLIGVASMSAANIELKAAANAKHHNDAFLGVQSLMDYVISDDAYSGGVVNYQTTNKTPQTVNTYSTPAASNLVATVQYLDCTKGHGNSLEASKGFGYGFFQITGTGQNASGTSSSVQGQGVKYPSAAC